MILNFLNLSQRFENSALGLLYPTLEGERLIKAENLNFHQVKRIFHYDEMFLILTEEKELYHVSSTNVISNLSMLRELKGKKIVDVSVSYYLDSALILTEDGLIYAMGNNKHENLGVGKAQEIHFPKQVTALDKHKVIQVKLFNYHCLALSEEGKVFSWGLNEDGVLGLGEGSLVREPKQIKELKDLDIVQISGGFYHSSALTKCGRLYTWGNNTHGQLGLGYGENRNTPSIVLPLQGEKITQIRGGRFHNIALIENGTVWTWGMNFNGQLGLKDDTKRPFPVIVESLKDKEIVQVFAQNHSSFALTKKGELYGWGFNKKGELGLIDRKNRYEPTIISYLHFKNVEEEDICL